MPDITFRRVGTAHSLCIPSFKIEGVVFRQYKVSRSLVNGVVFAAKSEIGRRKKARYIGVVGQYVVAQSVGLVGIHFAEFFVNDTAEILDSLSYLGRKCAASLSRLPVLCYFLENLGKVQKLDGGKHI